MGHFVNNISLVSCSLLMCSFFIILFTLNSKSIKNNLSKIIELVLLVTLFIIKMYFIIKDEKIDISIDRYSEMFYLFFVSNVIILILFYYLNKDGKINIKQKIILLLDYIVCIFSFYLNTNYIYTNINNIVIIGLIAYNIIYFLKIFPKIIHAFSIFYIINFITMLDKNMMSIFIFGNLFIDLFLYIIVLYKIYTSYIKSSNIKYLKVKSALNRLAINIKMYEEKLNSYRNYNKFIEKKCDLEEQNLYILLGQLNKSALLIDAEDYIINNDVVFKSMFNKYKNYDDNIELKRFLKENIVEQEKFYESVKEVRYTNESRTIQIQAKDGRIFDCKFSLYDEYELYSVICILSDITHEVKITSKIQENDIKYKKIVENIPYSIILERNQKIFYNNNKINIDLEDENIKNIIFNEATKGEIHYINQKNEEIYLKVDKMKFNEDNEEINLIEIKDISINKKLMINLEKSANKYEVFIDTIPEAICVLDYSSKEFEYANNTFYKLFKIQDIENLDLDEIYKDVIISSGKLDENIKYIRKSLKDGYGKLINVEISVILIDINRLTKMVLIIKDIKEELKIETMKKEIEKSEIINKDRDDFFINMSHELFTPANMIYVSNQLIKKSFQDIIKKDSKGEFAYYINVTQKHVNILITLINKTIELSELESNYCKYNGGAYNIVPLCEDIVNELNKYISNKNIKIVFDTDEEDVYALINPTDVGKAILTLLSIIVKNSKIKSIINFKISVKREKVVISIENLNRYNCPKNLDVNEEKILNLSISIAKLIINMYKGKLIIKSDNENCILLEIEFEKEEDIKKHQKIIKTIDKKNIYDEYKKICYL